MGSEKDYCLPSPVPTFELAIWLGLIIVRDHLREEKEKGERSFSRRQVLKNRNRRLGRLDI